MVIAADQKHHHLYICNRLSVLRFLVDTGTEIRTFPLAGTGTRPGKKFLPLTVANSSIIRTYGTCTIPDQL